jgi:hypothetical protein
VCLPKLLLRVLAPVLAANMPFSELLRQRCPNAPEAVRIAPYSGHEIKLGGGYGRGVRVSHTLKMRMLRTLLGLDQFGEPEKPYKHGLIGNS